MPTTEEVVDLLVIGAGPTGIAIGAEAVRANLSVLLVDRGALTAAILEFPSYMTFFTTRDKLEIARVPLTIPDEKPTRQQALVYYRAVAEQYRLPLALHEDVVNVTRGSGIFSVETRREGQNNVRRAKAVALATGYFRHPLPFTLPGHDLPWVKRYYQEPYAHYRENVVIVGGGNSACETALDLWRNGAGRVTMVVRAKEFKDSVKYWVRPDIENRIAEGAIDAHFETAVCAFHENPRRVEVLTKDGARKILPADSAYVFIGFSPDVSLQRRSGVQIDAQTLIPVFNPQTCESNVPGLYIAGTLQAGRFTDRIFIENSREHAPLIVNHLVHKLRGGSAETPPVHQDEISV